MNISYNWLRQYVHHTLSSDDLAERLTMAGLEVEDVEAAGADLDGVVVGHVLEAGPHPNADRLTLCRVDVGLSEAVQIVCGAPNVAAGQKVPVATLGTTLQLPSREDPTERVPLTIKRAKLRGEVSEGMICAEDELGLGSDHSGILVLDGEAPIGQPFADYLAAQGVEAGDHVLDIAITPNRPDAVSHLGVARDVAALEDLPLLRPDVELPGEGGEAGEQMAVDLEAPEACPRYVALLVRGVAVGESPLWLKRRLEAVGLRPVNNIVDVTNYVMYECGQPLHAFDYDQIAGHRIVVRSTSAEEPFTTLDGKARTLPAGTLLICDAERPVAIAGVMGGENSEVTDVTANVLIESAYFDPSLIRRTAKALGLQTDASYRFERGVDRDGQVWAAARAAHLMQEVAGGDLLPGVVDAHVGLPEPRVIALRPGRVEHLLGVAIPEDEVVRLLTAIGFEVSVQEPLRAVVDYIRDGGEPDEAPARRLLHCTVPTFRPDIEREVDVIEEVARLYGYDRVPEPTHSVVPNMVYLEGPSLALRREARALAAGLGFREVYTNSMLSRERAQAFEEGLPDPESRGLVETLNPISQEMAALRPSLLPGVLGAIAFNQNHGQKALRLMEFGHVFHRTDGAGTVLPGYLEREVLLIAMSGLQAEAGWDTAEREADLFDLKGAVEVLLDRLRVADVAIEPSDAEVPAAAYHLEVRAGEARLGLLAKVSDAVAGAYDLRAPVYFAELDWGVLVQHAEPLQARRYERVSRYPVAERDVAVVVSQAQPVGPMLSAVREAGGALLRQARVFDLYEGRGISEGQKSIAFGLRFGADRTLKDEEVEAQVRSIIETLEDRFGAALRG